MFNVGPPPGQPPSGPPQGAAPGETPPTPRKKMGIRAGVYRIKTGLIRAVAGPEKKKTEKKSKKEKTGQTPAPVPTNTNALMASPAPAPVIVMPDMPAPVTADDHDYHTYMAQQGGQQMVPLPMPVIVTTQQPHPFTASQPATHQSPPQPTFSMSASQPAKDWNTRASECMADLLDRLERGDPDEVASGFAMMQDVARERKFTGDAIDGWISSALAGYTPDALKSVYENAISLLPDSLLAKSVRLGIRRMLAPHEMINALLENDGIKALQFADALLSSCYPAKWGDQQPDDAQVSAMMKRMMDRVLATLTDRQIYALHVALTGPANHPAILVLGKLLLSKYAARILGFVQTADHRDIHEFDAHKS